MTFDDAVRWFSAASWHGSTIRVRAIMRDGEQSFHDQVTGAVVQRDDMTGDYASVYGSSGANVIFRIDQIVQHEICERLG